MSGELDTRNANELTVALDLARRTVYKDYVNEIGNYPLVAPSERLMLEKPEECLRVFHLTQLTRKKDEDVFQKLSTVYHAAMSLGSSLFVMLDVAGLDAPVNIYLGIHQPLRANETERQNRAKMSVSFDALRDGLNSNFPGSQIQPISASKTLPSELDKIFAPVSRCIASVSCVASVRDKSKTESKDFVQGLEKLVDVMRGKPYTAILIADPISVSEQADIRGGYESLYSTLSAFRKSVWSYNETESLAVMESLSHGTSESVTDSVTQTQSHTIGKTTGTSNTFGIGAQAGMNQSQQNSASVSEAYTESRSTPTKTARVGQFLGGLAPALGIIPIVGPIISPIMGGVGGAMSGASVMKGVTRAIARGVAESIGVSGGLNMNYFHARSKSLAESDTASSGTSTGTTKGSSETSTEGTTDTKGTGRTLQIENVNKSIEEMLSRIEAQLRRVKEGEDYGAYNCGAYFLSSKKEYALLAANTYRALMLGEGSAVENSSVNIWDDTERVTAMKEYLRRFTQPIFALPVSVADDGSMEYSVCSPGTIVSGLELPLHLGLPTKSVMGLAVVDHAEFGRNPPVTTRNSVRLGEIYHMGQTEKRRLVTLDRQNLTAHTFITGSTGSGKSNTVYMLLNRLCLETDNPVKFLVIEPAKGEYKNTLGGYPGVSVYGTNPTLTSLLRINPFSFPAEIHVLEHIDRLVEVFNACWPMYAAMPAVLKDAIESAYADCGWSLSRSACLAIGRFPTFVDVLKKLPEIMSSSAYSTDTKGDYVGALVTRVKSLTSGLNGQILCSDEELPNVALFDENAIIDLSRIGSTETKALFMGILMIKLQEYRMAKAEDSDEELRHITVLEEAHNLLRRTTFEQSQESSNLQGKSVEMFANAIAEMRTYGEGFVIADQAPGLLDMAVIRNTNTKIILRLPDSSDRELAGKASNLNDNQILELAKLERGVAAVYQNEWQEPMLCKVDCFEAALKKPYHRSLSGSASDPKMNAFFHLLLYGTTDGYELTGNDADKLKLWIDRQEINCEGKDILQSVLDAPHTIQNEQRRRILFGLLHGPALVSLCKSGASPEMVRGLVNQRISDTLHVREILAEEIRKLIFIRAADQAREMNDEALYHELTYYGGVR